MKIRAILAAASIAGLAVGGSVALAESAGAATTSCISTTSCGGADLAFSGHGPLSLAVLSPDKTVNGGFGYNDEHVGFTTSGASDGTQDWTLLKDSSVTNGGLYGNGEFALEYTPGGHQPAAGDMAYCLSIQDSYPTVGGKVVQRWADVLRWCGTSGRWGTPQMSFASTGDTIANPDLYQLFGLTEAPGQFLQLEDIALNSSAYRHGFGGSDFVVDDRAYGASGTWAIVFPNHFGSNQEGTANGCTEWITSFNPADFNCPVNTQTTATPVPTL